MLRRIALGLSGVAVLLSVLNCDAGNPRSRRVQFDSKAQTLQDIEDWKEVVDPDTCPVKQYSVALTLTAVTLADGLSCFSAEGGVSPFVQFEMGGKTIRSRTEEDQQFPVYLETFQLGCQDIQEPLVISVVNSQTGQTCFSNTVRHWSYGRTGVYTDTQPALSENARSGGTGLIKDTQQSYSYVLKTGPSTMDLTINALPGPQETASKWNVHTPADIFGIVFGMMIFVGVVGYFVWKIRNSASGPAPAPAPPSAPEALAMSSHGTENRKKDQKTGKSHTVGEIRLFGWDDQERENQDGL
ncbi:C2 calcium-dependent membrane targeting [Nannochloropsis gaditana]|uniref:C2 calcium-dependent membrane targeting n=1 Tax=Nannochloropsis gaditana TaxID=72520 RepID=W7U0A4_9STRA|nr:C2 calcium-dependent membrane targeting [Nannochloropsis gaditana]